MNKETIEKIADLARLKLSDAEISKYTTQISDILEYVKSLEKVNTSGVEPMAHALDLNLFLAEDEVVKRAEVADILATAPEQLYDTYKVPQVIGGEH